MSTLPTIPAPESYGTGSDLLALLDKFDSKRHGGEVMAFAPVGREFGIPDYEKPVLSSGDTEAQ